MKFINLIPAFSLFTLMVSCSPGGESNTSEAADATYEAPAEQTQNADSEQAGEAGDIQQTQTFNLGGDAAKTGGKLSVNPPHGEPGHRCDIDVGAPLNSAATKPAPDKAATSPTTSPAAAPTISAPTPAVTTPAKAAGTSGKMNPAHGEPGHRCDIAVGAPL